MFRRCLELLSSAKRLPAAECDEAIAEFSTFLADVQNDEKFISFKPDSDRLDNFWNDQLAGSRFKKLWKVVRMLLLLSHGQASVERGFSENKEIMTTNMSEKCLVSLRAIGDHVKNVGGLHNVEITKPMLFAAASSRHKYCLHLDDQKKAKEEAERRQKRKAVMEELDDLKKKKRRTEDSMKALQKSADEFAEQAENKGDMTLLAKSNAMRKSAKQKQQELASVEQDIQTKLNSIASE